MTVSNNGWKKYIIGAFISVLGFLGSWMFYSIIVNSNSITTQKQQIESIQKQIDKLSINTKNANTAQWQRMSEWSNELRRIEITSEVAGKISDICLQTICNPTEECAKEQEPPPQPHDPALDELKKKVRELEKPQEPETFRDDVMRQYEQRQQQMSPRIPRLDKK